MILKSKLRASMKNALPQDLPALNGAQPIRQVQELKFMTP
jgi:hypothetical protein